MSTVASTVRPLAAFGRSDLAEAGGKGANLGELVRAGFPVPPGFVVTTAAYSEFIAAAGLGDRLAAVDSTAAAEVRESILTAPVPEGIRRAVVDAYADLGRPPVAVRSSATAEDLADASFAGQQDTYLNVCGDHAVVEAVRRCWASLWTDRAVAYRARHDVDPAGLALAVVVQEMVEADAAGVLFTANPTTGRRSEAVIAAAWGLGEAVVGGQVDTDDLVVAKADGRVLSRRTADKAVATVYAPGGTAERELPSDRRRLPVLDDQAVAELVGIGTAIEAHFSAPQDIEWARADGRFFVVQSRPVTALPLPEADPPTDWSVPDRTAMYVRASIVEQLPDPLTPLFADLVGSSVTRSLRALFAELTAADVVRDTEVMLPTVNGYAYYYYSRAGMARLMLHSPKALRWLVTGEAQDRWRERSYPAYAATVEAWRERDLGGLSAQELLSGVTELLDAGTTYYTSVQTIIPIAATSEILFTAVYDRLVRRPGDPPAATFLVGYDSLPIRAEKSLWDLAAWTRTDPGLTEALLAASTEELAGVATGVRPVPEGPGWAEWRRRFAEHLDAYGHTVYNLDFANAVPADDPAPLLETLRYYLRGEAGDPYERQRASADRREQATAAVLARLDPVRDRLFTRALRWAQRVAPVREDALGAVGLAWPQMRRMLAELGGRLVDSGVLGRAADVYWLTREELLAAAGDPPAPLPDLAELVERRREVWRGQRRVTPPQVLPDNAWKHLFDGMMPATTAEQAGHVLTGIGASAGRVTAPARVLSGPEDFGRMRPGDVLVASITTPAWTPLFALASAVVTDIGGPLSHSSIVAREYGIPAVLGTAVATKRIADGETITVDGDAGTITVPTAADQPETAAQPGVGPGTTRRLALATAAALGGLVVLRVLRRRRGHPR